MIFLLIRFLPYFILPAYFLTAQGIFAFNDFWQWLMLLILALIAFYFILLKVKSPYKPVLFLALFALIFAFAGLAYSFILENTLVINFFLVFWSIVLWLYLESVFHDFYETSHQYILNLDNITLYGNILVVFFLSASFLSWQIFLNFSFIWLFSALVAIYFCLFYLAFLRQKMAAKSAIARSLVLVLLLAEVMIGFKLLPVSFYVSSACLAVLYYLFFNLLILSERRSLDKKSFIKYFALAVTVILLILLTAVWL